MAERISIAIPFYRRLDYLEIAVESVLAQERSQWRLLVVDDGEVDQGAEAVVRSLSDARVAYHRNPGNLGMVPTWNACLDRCDTELVTLLHGDDRLLPGYVGLMLDLAARFPEAAALCCEAQIIDAAGERAFSLADAVKPLFRPRGGDPLVVSGEPGLRALMAGNFIMCPTLCYRKAVLQGRRFSNEWKQVQDLDFTSRLLLEDEAIVCSRRVAYAYRRHPEGATAAQSESRLRFDEEFRLFESVAERSGEKGWPRAARFARSKRVVRLHLLYRALHDLVRLHPVRSYRWLRYLAEHR
jgi:glycosyltransferase involved in cell wall biosynthesis